MHQSGPIFPLFLLSTYAVAGRPFDSKNWFPPLAAQSLLAALSCVLIAATASLGWNRSVGMVSGILAALYPGFIVNSVEEAIAATCSIDRLDRHACRDTFLRRFSVTRMADDYVELYKRLVVDDPSDLALATGAA